VLPAPRFSGELTQSQIAARIGISQMDVSRLLSQILTHLRQQLEEEDQATRQTSGRD